MKALIILSILSVLILYAGFLKNKKVLLYVSAGGLLLALVTLLSEWGLNKSYFNSMMVVDNYALAFDVSMTFTSLLIVLLANNYYKNVVHHVAEMYALIVLTLAGTYIMTSFGNLVMLFLGLEIMSISLYVLAGGKKKSIASNEASFKYFLMGSFASAVLLFGIALIYGASGSFYLSDISKYVTANKLHLPAFFYTGIVMMVIGLSFKVAAAPFHFWAPDVYQGSPTLINAFMATVAKTASFAAFFRLTYGCLSDLGGSLQTLLWCTAVLTMLAGNITGLLQTRVKRLLAYSSIGHTGFLLIAMVAMNQYSASSILYYTLAYSVSTIAGFAVLILVKSAHGGDGSIDSFNGLYKTSPFHALVMTLSMLSLAGIPVTAGFFAKYYIFVAAVKGGFYWLTIIGVLTALMGIFYYFKLLYAMYLKDGNLPKLQTDIYYNIALALSAIITLALGIFPSYIIKLL